MANNKIELRKIKDSFFEDNKCLLEIMRKEDKKVRGYGYINCLVDGYNFAIPLRSAISHKHGFPVSTPQKGLGFKGLDYTKAIIIDPKYLSSTFTIPNHQFSRIYRNQNIIIQEFSEYISVYKDFFLNGTLPEEYSGAYRFTTLINYHNELGLTEVVNQK